MIRTDLFDFELPEDRIAAYPSGRRGEDRLLVLNREDGSRQHRRFPDILEYLRPGDLLVVNDTRVRRARLAARRETGGHVEVMLLAPAGEEGALWECLTRSNRPVPPGTRLNVESGLDGQIISRREKTARVLFSRPLSEEDIERLGRIPLPPYIVRMRKKNGGEQDWEEDPVRYQTVFARETGAVAAPTAGLHFTEELLDRVCDAGIGLCTVTLEVGWGTFAPVETDVIETHRLHEERYRIPEEAAVRLNAVRESGGRVIAVGTTVVRTLESAVSPRGFRARSGATDIFIKPGYAFRAVDALITNFHTPRSTLLMLVSAFAGRERVLDAYREAVETGYRFYSYGDAMLIL